MPSLHPLKNVKKNFVDFLVIVPFGKICVEFAR